MQRYDYIITINGYEIPCTIVYTFHEGYTELYQCHGPQSVQVPSQVEISDIYYLDAGAVRKSIANFVVDMAPGLLDEIKEEIRGEHE